MTVGLRTRALLGLVLAWAACGLPVRAGEGMFSVAGSVPATRGWIQRDAAAPPARELSASAYDSARAQTLLFGGRDLTLTFDDTWLWNGFAWKSQSPPTKPSPRHGHDLVEDSGGGLALLFGGDDGTGTRLGDTWLWNGTTWAQQTPLSSPSARKSSRLVYDSRRQRVVLFGGDTDSGRAADTWEWNGTDWAQQSTATSPPPLELHALAYDASRGVTVLFGGKDTDSSEISQTWEYDGANWNLRTPATAPPARKGARMVFDSLRGVTVLYGGFQTGPGRLSDTWEWDGSNWKERFAPASPDALMDHALTYDRIRGRLVLHGGTDASGASRGHTWEYDGLGWTKVGELFTNPPVRGRHDLAYDSVRRRTVLFGGKTGTTFRDDTWEWDGVSWTQLSPSTRPGQRDSHRMTYFRRSGETLYFGGVDVGDMTTSETWVWTGSDWVQKSPATSPGPRRDHSLTFDPSRGTALFFGGHDGSGYRQDTWEWNGLNWVQRTPSTQPSQRQGHGVAYDSSRRKAVLFGGFDDTILGQTWEWDGTDWAQLSPANAPPDQLDHQMVFDSFRKKTFLFPGDGGVERYWEWDGTNWSELTFAGGRPTDRYAAGLVYDERRQRVVLFAGLSEIDTNDTWELPSDSPPSVTATFSPASPLGSEAVTLKAHATDTDGDTLAFRWTQTSGPAVTLSNRFSAIATFATTVPGEYGFLLGVWDGHEGWAYASAKVTVLSADNAFEDAPSVPGERTWVRRDAPVPFARENPSAAFDLRRGRTILYGGANSSAVSTDETWSWDGFAWKPQSLPSSPPARNQAATAYDAARHKTVIFGGHDGSRSLTETWELDAAGWVQKIPATSPPARRLAGMAFDASRSKLVMFGGHDGSNYLGDTWEWDGTSWLQRFPGSAPDARYEHGMAYDPVRRTVLLFGGANASGPFADTWEWNGTTWSPIAVDGSPAARSAFGLATDLRRRRLVLFGGYNGFGDTWEWDGVVWSNKTPASGPPARTRHPLVYDAVRGKTVLFSGNQFGFFDDDTWEWDGTAWTKVSDGVAAPPARRQYAMAYDSTRKRVTMTGGDAGSSPLSGTFAWDSVGWTNLSTDPVPLRSRVNGAFDPARQRIVTFGGDAGGSALGDTEEFDGTSWIDSTPGSSPTTRWDAPLVHDSARGRVLLFSGDPNGPAANDTWSWSGGAWSQLTPLTSPPERRLHQLSYDSARDRVVLFGGIDRSNVETTDTWEFDGANWLAQTPTTRPTANRQYGMAYDPVRQRTVLFGGNDGTGSGLQNETWEWDGSAWVKLDLSALPSARSGHRMVYDSGRKRMVLFGGEGADSSFLSDTWELPSNTPPLLASAVFTPAAAPQTGELVTLSATATDADGDVLTYRWVQTFGPAGALSSAQNSSATFSSPLPGKYGFQVTVADGQGGFDFATRIIEIRQKEEPFEQTGNAGPAGRTWVRRDTALPVARVDHAVAQDLARGRLVLFGGASDGGASTRYGDTWTWDGTSWSEIVTATAPSPRRFHSMAYDAARQKVVLFGGDDATGFKGDTWEWNGSGWTERSVATSPSARQSPAMAFDRARSKIVLFGGVGASGRTSDTWEWDGSGWTERSLATAPEARESAEMEYHTPTRRLVLFGGSGALDLLRDTWTFDGTAWLQSFPESVPTSRAFFAMAEDARRGKVVLFGGSASGSVYSTETWEWDGGLWMDVSPATGPPGRERHGLAFDPVRNRTTLFGGFPGGADLLQDTWEFDGSSWKAASAPFVSPPGRVGTEMAYDPVRKQSVLFGGFTTANSDDTWLWDGTGWANPSPAGKPGIRTNHRMVFRQDLAKLLLFGGDLGGTRYQDTWSWDGTTWADLRPATDPPARAFHVLSHDPATSRSILFGGSTTSVVADTWVYTGGDWRNVTPGSGNPFGRSEAAMAHDPDGGRELLFGGENSGAFALSDTWQWTGTGWSQLAPAHAPANRKQHRMVHDAFRGRLVLFGGKTDAGTALGDTWEFDGTDWTELVLATSPSARADGFAMAYDSSRRRVLLFGGSANLTDTWELPSNSPPAVFSATASPAPAQVNRVIQLAASASDPDGKPLVYRWLQTYGSAVAIASSTSAAASFTATVSGEYGFLAAVEDGDGGAAFALTSITVGLPAQLAIGTIDAVPDFVSLGQTGAIVRVPISNTGGAPARITAASLAFTPSATGFTFLGDPGNVSTLAAGASAVLTFSVDIGSAAALGLTTIDCNVVAEDAVSGAGASDPTGPDALDDWTVQRRAALDTLVVDATASSVVRGESGKPVTLSVRNTGEATANVTGVALTFNGAQAGYLVVPSGTNPLTISGGVTETFVFDVAIQPAAAPGPTTIDATVTAVDANSAAPAGDTTGALTTDSWTVLREARLELRRVSVQPSSVTRGDSVTGLELVVENTGESAASVTSATLSFGAGGPGYAIARTDPVSSVLPSEQATFVFNVDVGFDAPVGLTVIDGFVAGVDSSGSGLITSDSSADVTDSWTVAAVPAALRVLEIDAAPNGVERGQSGVTVRMFVKNTGQNPASLTTATLSFNGGTAGYVSAPAMSPPSSIAGGSTVELDFSVSVDSNAPLGRTTLDGAVTGVDQVTTAGLSDSDGADEPDLWTVTGAAAAVSAGQSLPATRSWVRRDSPMPGSRQYARSVYDAKRGRVVLFGGENLGTPLGDSWEWDGLVWREPVLAAGPSARSKMAFAFDESRKVAVLFGGTANGTTALGETWEYDGSAWTQKSPATSPQALAGAAMAYDPARKVVLLFGGAPLPAAPVAETWEWNGTNWSQRTPASSPPARKLHAMAADPARNRVVLFGGSGGSGAALGDTWAWDGTGWSDISPATGPSNRRGAELVHDAFAGRLVLFGGEDASPSGETWTFDGTSWQNISPANASPAPRAGAALAFDFARGAAVMFGGSVSGSPDAETWELDGGAWTMRLRPFAGPSARSYHAVAYDEARGETVLFGGDDGALNGETWRWNGAEWLNSTPGLSPSTRSEAGMAYDADRQRVVLFGGKTGASQITSETWEWDGSAWSNPRPALLPPARRLGPLAHVAQNGIALFGGTSADGSADLTDTFKWDGANWFALSPANPPSGRRDHALAYDAGRQRLVTYGGSFNGGDRTDTHELDASSWTQVVPATRPAAVRGYSLAHDAFRKRTVLFGGKDATASRSDTFEWDGVNWAVVPLATSPPARFGSPMAYDTARRRLVLFGGSTDAPARLSDTWELPADSPPTVTARFSPPAPVPGQTVFLVAEATDPDPGTDFSFHWRQPSGPSVGLSFADSAAAQFTAAQTGPVTFQVAASDGAGGHGLASVTVDVQTTAAVRIDSVTAAAAVVSTGQVGLAVEMRLTNTGGRAANVTAASLELASAGPVDRTSQYSQSVAPALPLTVAAGVTRVVTFTVGVGASATTGLITLNGRVTASDAATGSDASSVGAVVTDSWTVQRRAALALRSVAASPGAVSRGQTVAGVTFTAANTGEAAASVAAAGLTFGGTTTGYTQSQAGGPASIAGGATVTFTFTVTVGAGAALGPQTIDATVTASDANAAALGASDAAADAADSWTVQTPAALSAAALVAPSGVSRGSTVAVTLPVANSGQASAQVTSVQLVWSDARLVSALRTPLPVAVAGGTTASFEFDVAAALTATVSGSVTGAATVRGADVNSLAPLTATNTAAGNLAVRNVVPTALATGPLSGPSGVTVSFDGSGSFDGPAAGSSEGDALVYVWSLVSKPSGSALGASSFVPNSAAGNPLTALAPDRKGSWIIGLSVSDGFDSSIVSTTPFTVLNTAPRARAGADFSSPIGTQLTLDGRASSDADPEDTLVYTWTAPLVPAASTVTATSLLPNGTAAAARPSVLPDRPGVYEFELSASDSQATSTDRVQVTVTNQPPVARASVVGGVSLTAPVALSGQASTDAESQPLSYRWSFAAVPPGSLVTAFSANNGPSAAQTSFQPDLPGEYSVQLVVNDGFADSAAASLVVTVTDRPPVARASVVGTVAATRPVQLTGEASTDFEGQVLSYRWSLVSAPGGTGAGTFTPNGSPGASRTSFQPDFGGVYTVQLVVSDGRSDSAPATLLVTVTNSLPIARVTGPGTIAFGNSAVLDGRQSSDPEGAPLGYSWRMIGKPATSGLSTGSLNPTAGATASRTAFLPDRIGTYTLDLTVIDGVQPSVPAVIQVTAANFPPEARVAAAAQSGVLGTSFTLDARGTTDPNPGDTLTYRWRVRSVPARSTLTTASIRPNDSTTSVVAQLAPDLPGRYELELQVTDTAGATGTASLRVDVTNTPPVARVSVPAGTTVTQSVTLDGSGSSDAETPAALEFRWRLTSRPAGSSITTAAFRPNDSTLAARTVFKPDRRGSYGIELTVGDGVATARAAATLVVANSPPEIRAPLLRAGAVRQPVTLDATATFDPDPGDSVTYAWRLVAAPKASRLGAQTVVPFTTGTARFTPDAAGTYTARLTVTDTPGAVSRRDILIVASAPGDPPIVALASPSRVLNLQPAAVSVLGSALAPLDSIALFGPLSVPGRSPSTVPLSFTSVDGSRADVTVPAGTAAGQYGVLAISSGRASRTATQPLLTVVAPGPLRLAEGENPLLIVGPENDADAVAAEVQAAVELATAQPDGTALTLEALRSRATGSAQELRQARAATVSAGRATFGAVSLGAAETHVLTVRDAATGVRLARAVATAGGPPAAIADTDIVDGGAPQQAELVASASRGQFGPIRYRWTLVSAPLGAASLDSEAPVTSFRAARAGRYELDLVVSDARGAAATAAVRFGIVDSPPRADAGPDVQLILPDRLGRIPAEQTATSVSLDGRGSGDPNDDPISYFWEVVEQPERSGFVASRDLSGQRTARPVLQLGTATDAGGALLDAGRYVLRLTVSDAAGVAATDEVEILAIDPDTLVPDADAGLDRTVRATIVSTAPLTLAGDIPDPLDISGTAPIAFVRLDGRESVDPNVPPRPLGYRWVVVSVPPDSAVTTLSGAATAFPGFIPDRPGSYRFRLTVSNGRFEATPDEVDVLVLFVSRNRPPKAEASVEARRRGLSSRTQTQPIVFRIAQDRVTLDGRLSADPDPGDTLRYSWIQTRGPSVQLSPSATAPVVEFVPLETGRYGFRLRVVDPSGAPNESATLELLGVPLADTPPRLAVVASSPTTVTTGQDFDPEDAAARPRSLRVRVGSEVVLRGTAADPEAALGLQRLALRFRQVAGPTVLLTTRPTESPLISEVSFVPTTSRVHVFDAHARQLTAEGVDTGVETVRRVRVVVDSSTNGVPNARLTLFGFKDELAACQVVTLDGTPSRDQGPNSNTGLLYRWVQVGGPPVTLSNPFSSIVTFVTPDFGDDASRLFRFQLFVDDGNDRSEPDAISLVVAPGSQNSGALPLARGASLITVPLDPGGERPYRVADLLSTSGAPFAVALTRPADGGAPRWRVLHPALGGDDQLVRGAEGYLLVRPNRPSVAVPLAGRKWASQTGQQRLSVGLNLVGYPRGHPEGEDVETLRARAGASFVVDTTDAGRFRLYLPPLTPPYPVEEGKSYLLSVPRSTTLTLPGCQ